MADRVLVVDDEENIRELVRAVLEQAGYQVSLAIDGQEGLRRIFSEPPDLVVLDVMMPKMDGPTLLQRIREVSDVPVIMLTALGQEADKVRGLRGGADDYLVKPFGGQELLARIEAVRRRVLDKGQVRDTYEDKELRIDFQRHQVHVRTTPVKLTALEFKLLSVLVHNKGIVLSTDRLLDLCWGERVSGPESVRVYIGSLRRKLEVDPSSTELIETVRGFGYRYRNTEHEMRSN